MQYTIRLLFTIILFGLTTEVIGGPFSYVSIGKLEKSADAIVIGQGRVLSSKGTEISVGISVYRTLKGTIMPQNQVIAMWTARSENNATVNPSQNVDGMWFLKSKGDTSWEILPIASGDVYFRDIYIPTSTDSVLPDFAYTATAKVTEKILNEIGSQLQRTAGNSRTLAELYGGLLSDDFDTLPQLHAKFASSPLPRVRILGLQGLIRNGNGAALSELANDSNLLGVVAKESYLLGSAISNGRSQDQSYIAALGRLALPGAPKNLRQDAVYALRAIHSQHALPHLVQLLDSDSADLRYDALIGLASFANNLPMQTPENAKTMGWLHAESTGPYTTEETLQNMPSRPIFDQQEQQYIEFWKRWWITNKATLIH